jgi:hypothetical protein
MLIACLPSAVFIIIALIITIFFAVSDKTASHYVINSILTGLAISVTIAFIVCIVGSITASVHLKMHNLHTFIQINEKSLVVSEFMKYSFTTNTAVKSLFICDIRDIDDFLLTGGKIVIKLKTAAAKKYVSNAKMLSLDVVDDTIVLCNDNMDLKAASVKKISILDAFALPLRIAQRIFLVAGNVREREARRKRFRQEMLDRAAKAPRYKTLRDRFRPELKKIKRF